jgi:hypothetical protein
MIADQPTPERAKASRVMVVDSAPAVDRFAYVRSDAFAEAISELADLPLRPSIITGAERVASWSVETQPAQQEAAKEPPISSWRMHWLRAKPTAPKQRYTLKTRLAEISPTASVRLAAKFEAAKAVWPPSQVALVAIKDERALELHARSNGGSWTRIHRYRVLAASGGSGPKLRQGDRQVPEGMYGISYLNPNGAFHVSLRVNYPNAFDRQMATHDGRKDLGGDIMIHGKNLSAGCLAMGDEAVEELFLLAAQIGLSNIKLIIAPTDFRHNGIPAIEAGRPEWLPKLYAEIATAMAEYKAPPKSTGLLSFFMKPDQTK